MPILPGLEDLWDEASDLWDELHEQGNLFNFVASDYEAVYHALVGLQGQAANRPRMGLGAWRHRDHGG